MDLTEHPIFKVALPGIPLLYYLLCIGMYFGDWCAVVCQSPKSISFWGVVILYYLSIQVPSQISLSHNSGITFVLLISVLMWFAVALVSYQFNSQLQNFQIGTILKNKNFYFSWIGSCGMLFVSLLFFFSYEPTLNQYRKQV